MTNTNGNSFVPVSIYNPATGETKGYTVDTSFEPYRREAFRHRSIPSQRQSIMMTNIVGEGTVNTEGLWRREQVEWSMGAGQYSLDRKNDSQETRFYQSKGVDVFSWPLQATLLPDVQQRYSSSSSTLLMSRCGDNVVIVDGTTVQYFVSGSWSTSYPMTISGSPTIYSMATNDTVVYLATSSGIWYATPGSVDTFALYAAVDSSTGFDNGYTMVAWANDQLIASNKNRLYAFQPRTSTSYPYFGQKPSVNDVSVAIDNIDNYTWSSYAQVTTLTPHGLVPGQPIKLSNVSTDLNHSPNVLITSIKSGTVVLEFYYGDNPFSVGDTINITYNVDRSGTYTVQSDSNVTVTSVSDYSLTYANSTIPTADYPYFPGGGISYGTTVDRIQSAGSGSPFNADFTVLDVDSVNPYIFTIASTPTYGASATGGNVTSSTTPDVLVTHENPHWVWSDAAGGETQVYFSGYVQTTGGHKGSGCVYRSDMLGASTVSNSGVLTITASSATLPWNLDVPVQALPMSPDEYPTCIQSYLNYIFVGTNRGVRMTQTLSVYDPTATATGDLKSGPLIPNILQPIDYPVTAIIGDGRYVWFSWNHYDSASTGLGRLDLGTFIAQDPLAPAYASDLMVPCTNFNATTGVGVVTSLDWDPTTDSPMMAVQGLGIYTPYATNMGANTTVSQYVSSGTINSGVFDYGIAEQKIPVYVQYNAETPSGTSVMPSVILEPGASGSSTPTLTADPTLAYTYDLPSAPYVRANQFQVAVTLNSSSGGAAAPKLHRWTLKSWPAVVQGTEISVVIQLHSVNVVDGLEVFIDPYQEYIWLEQRRQNQDIIKYTEGPLSVTAVVDTLDWIPNKRRDNFENGYEGDLVVALKTIGQFAYNPPSTL